MSQVTTKIRAHLQLLNIKLWLDPYYNESNGPNDAILDELAQDLSNTLNISPSMCKSSLIELQNGALHKLNARKEFEKTGIATLSIRHISNTQGTCNVIEVKCDLAILGKELLEIVAKNLNVTQPERIKCIAAGKTLNVNQTLLMQNITNNQQLMVIISKVDEEEKQSTEHVMLDRIQKIKNDIEMIVNSNQQLFELEDQDGNPVFVPPGENRALLMALGFYEKARAALKRECYDEALILLLEADEKFRDCNSNILDLVDNYALVNLDIVWCYMCLQNILQLPDAQRRLDICEKNLYRSYGEGLERLINLKGYGSSERAIITRLHILQGVTLYYQNRRNEAYEKLLEAEKELISLKVNDESLQTLIEIGFETHEARLGLRECHGNVEHAVNYIHEWRERKRANRKKSKKERKLNEELAQKKDEEWVNPHNVCTLVEMGFIRDLAVQALKLCDNNLIKALDMLQTRSEEIRQNLLSTQNGPSTSRGVDLQNASSSFIEKKKQLLLAYQRFQEELNNKDFDDLDVPLLLEEQILIEYKRLLE